ncbi:MAG: hypothetical protein FWD90_08460 [Defluviitaleaceae bacterium]|nr:hypothetical protein [Defluviitaleaceae bacterium]
MKGILVVGVILVVVAVFVTGCGGGGNDSQPTMNQQGQTEVPSSGVGNAESGNVPVEPSPTVSPDVGGEDNSGDDNGNGNGDNGSDATTTPIPTDTPIPVETPSPVDTHRVINIDELETLESNWGFSLKVLSGWTFPDEGRDVIIDPSDDGIVRGSRWWDPINREYLDSIERYMATMEEQGSAEFIQHSESLVINGFDVFHYILHLFNENTGRTHIFSNFLFDIPDDLPIMVSYLRLDDSPDYSEDYYWMIRTFELID